MVCKYRTVLLDFILQLVLDIIDEVPARLLACLTDKGTDNPPSLCEMCLQVLDNRSHNGHALVAPAHTGILSSVQLVFFPLLANILEVKNARIVEILTRNKNFLKVRWVGISNWMVMCIPCEY